MELRGYAGWCDYTEYVLFSDQSLSLFLNGVQVGVTTSVPYLNFVSTKRTLLSASNFRNLFGPKSGPDCTAYLRAFEHGYKCFISVLTPNFLQLNPFQTN